VLLLLPMPVPSPLARAAPTQPAALALDCLVKPQHRRSARAQDSGKGLCLGVTPPRPHLQDSASDSRLVSVSLGFLTANS